MIRNRFTLKQLEALVYVVDRGTFRGAATALGTTQPNISARISALESALGDVLLIRDAGSVRLTRKGDDVLAQARTVLRCCETLLETADRRDLVEERLRLGVTELVACTWLHTFMRALRQEYPALQIELEVHLATEVGRKLSANELDLAILSGLEGSSNIELLELFQAPYIWAACPQLAEKTAHASGLKELVDTGVITHARHTEAVAALITQCQSRGLPIDRIVHSSSLAACVPMAIDGMGVALLPQELVQPELDKGTLVQVESDWLPAPLDFTACYHAERAPKFLLRATEIALACASAAQR